METTEKMSTMDELKDNVNNISEVIKNKKIKHPIKLKYL